MNDIATRSADPHVLHTVGALTVPTLRDLLEDGFYLLFLLRDGNTPTSCVGFNHRIDRFFAHFDKQAGNFNKSPELIEYAKYAFCALLDEIALDSAFPLHDEWARNPLQLRLYSEHLAGEGFFDRLEELRREPVQNIEALKVFHICLLLGFQGKFLLDGTEKRDHLTQRLGQDIQRVRNEKNDFAPNWKLPHRFHEFIRNEIPMWLYFALLALVGTGVFVTFRVLLGKQASLILGA